MKKILFYISIIICFGTLFSYETSSTISFNITAEKEFNADMIILVVEIEKKSNDFVKASADCNTVIVSMKKSLVKAGLLEDDFVSKDIHNMPNDAFFKKDYTVRGLVNIKIKNISEFYKYSEIILNADKSVKILETKFEIQDKSNIKTELLKLAKKKLEKNKKDYENIFGIKLKLYSMRDFFNEVANSPRMKFEASSLYKNSSQKESLNMPLRKYNINMEIFFEIVHN